MTFTSAETTLIETLLRMFGGKNTPLNCFESFNIEEKMLYRKHWASETGSSHFMMIYARNWRFQLSTEQTANILSSVLHNLVSNSTVFCAFLVRRFTVL